MPAASQGCFALRACNGKIIRIAELASFTSEFRLRGAKVYLGVKALNRYHDSPLRRAARGDRLREVS
jgi:hypothetical protein